MLASLIAVSIPSPEFPTSVGLTCDWLASPERHAFVVAIPKQFGHE